MIDTKEMTQQERLLAMLSNGREVSNYEIHDVTGMFQAPARIFELKRKGYNIQGRHDEYDKRKYFYRLITNQQEGE